MVVSQFVMLRSGAMFLSSAVAKRALCVSKGGAKTNERRKERDVICGNVAGLIVSYGSDRPRQGVHRTGVWFRLATIGLYRILCSWTMLEFCRAVVDTELG